MRETRVQSLGVEDLLEKEMATHSSILAWKSPWMVEPGRLQSMGLQRVRYDWATSLSLSFSHDWIQDATKKWFLSLSFSFLFCWLHLKMSAFKCYPGSSRLTYYQPSKLSGKTNTLFCSFRDPTSQSLRIGHQKPNLGHISNPSN